MIYLLIMTLAFFTWTLTEYTLHRFLGHELRLMTLFKKEHLLHHARKDYYAPLWMKLVVAAFVISFCYLTLSLVVAGSYALTFALSFGSSFLFYEWFHFHLHVNAPLNKWGLILRKHHFYHHFTDPRVNHGVTTRIWDRIFGTLYEPEQVQIKRQFKMNWLVQTNEHFIVKESTPYT